MVKPTQTQIDNSIKVFEYILDSTKEHEPSAYNFINALEIVLTEMPINEDEIEYI